jgi:hypothetical protein
LAVVVVVVVDDDGINGSATSASFTINVSGIVSFKNSNGLKGVSKPDNLMTITMERITHNVPTFQTKTTLRARKEIKIADRAAKFLKNQKWITFKIA